MIPNPWDIGSARMLQHLGFAALASTSAGFAWTVGRVDGAVTRDDVLQHLAAISAAVDIPVNADFESGFAAEPGDVASNVALAIATGIAGFSIEDRDVAQRNELYDRNLAVERIRAAASARADAILVARTERLLIDPSAVTAAIDSLVAFAEAGADCLFAPGVRDKADIAAMVRAVAPKPLNVVVIDPAIRVAELADLGVRRISIGGSLARVAWGAMIAAAEQMKLGSFEAFATSASGKMLNETFG